MKKRMLSLLLTLVMVLGMLPATTMTANAATTVTEVDSWEELKSALTASGTATIKLTDDIKKTIELKEADGPMYKINYDDPQITVCGTKTLDLNGYTITVDDQSNAAKDYGGDVVTFNSTYMGVSDETQDRTLFVIPSGESLTINDSGSDGKIAYTGKILPEPDALKVTRKYWEYAKRDVFDVSGTLIVNGGTIEAGNTEKQWINGGRKNVKYEFDSGWLPGAGVYNHTNIDGEWFDSKYARQMVWGTAADIQNGGTLVVNGGTLIGRGEGETLKLNLDADEESDLTVKSYKRDSVIEYASGSTVLVNGGSFKALGGANLFEGNGDITVRAGYFKTDKHDNVRCFDAQVGRIVTQHTAETIITGSYGNLGIPDSAWKDEAARMQVFVNNAIYNGNAAGKVEMNETGGQTSGDALEVTIVPWLSDKKLPVTLNGGPYSNYPVSDGQVLDWNVSSDNLVATVDYDPYFADTTGLKNAAPVYTWHLWGHYGTNGEVSEDIVTTTGELDISAAWEEAAGTGNFRQMKVSCVVSEAPTNCAYRMETKTYEFRLDPTKTPLDESSLPGGEMEVDISYPAFSGLGTDIVVTVKPSAEDLADAAYGSSTVRYEYLYRDNMEEWEDEPHAWPHNTYNIPNADWGHVKIDVTMVVYGSDGLARRFHKSAWALKLPDITVSGATLNSDKTAYVGNPGTPVTLKAPIDVTNADIAADQIVASDIEGWYRVAYDMKGKPVYSNAPGEWNGTSVTLRENGTYCYAAYDRDGNLVYSKPVKVVFSAEAYGIGIKKSNDYIFTVYNNGGVVMPLTITATYGSSVSLGNIRWAIQSYPQGMSNSDFTYVNAHGKSAISFQKLFKDIKTIVPGNYLVMAYVVKDGQYLTASNAVTVEVGRIADFVDITDEAGNVISGKTMEGPYVGNTMKLNCVPGNGASAPSFQSVTWKVESLVGTNVATIDVNGVLTLNKPGQIKVTATATVGVGQTALANNTQSVIINIPITEVEVTLGTPAIGGDPASIASVPADAPYELDYDPEYSWASGVSTNGEFLGNSIPELSVVIAPKDGYVFPARQLYLEDYDKSWYTYADDIVVKVNGTAYNFRDFETTHTFWDPQEIDFYWKWERLIDPTHTYLDYVNLTIPIPAVGDGGDLAPDEEYAWAVPECTNTDAIYSWVNDKGIYKVSGDYLNDNDKSNDNAVKMADGETYQRGQMYRADIYFSTTNKNYTTYFGKNVTLMINGTPCQLVDLYDSTDVEGKTNGIAYYYFMPTAPIQTIDMLWIDDLEAPVGYKKPATADDITEFSSNFIVGDEVYVTRLTWFLDSNNNNVLDSGEDSAEFFNADGSFLAGLRYSVYLELEARDRDDDGKGDFVKFADNAVIKLTSQGNAQMTGNQNGAVYKFPAAAMPAEAVTTDPGQVTIELQEGYTGRPIETINVTSVGTTTVTSIVAVADDDTLIDVSYDGMTVYVLPADYGLAVGRYSTVIYIQNEYGGVYTTIPVTINVGEAVVTHTVTFKVDASAVDTKTVESGKTVTAPADPSQTGKKFVGWYIDGNVKFDFATPITGDLTLNAKFEDVIITHTVTFKVGTSAVDTKTVESGKTVTAPADPSQTGKKFVGWYTDGNVKFDFATPITGDLTLNAKFEDAVYVGGVGMCDGDYLAVGATATQTTKPSGGYAYYKNGTLTLNNYSYEGKGYLNSSSIYYAVIYSKNDLTLELIGNNTLTQTESNSYMICVSGAKLIVGGDGKLTGTAERYALCADKDITINGGTVEVSTRYASIFSYGDVIINDGDITAESKADVAIYSLYDVTVNGGNVTAIGSYNAIGCGSFGSFSVAEGMKIQASTTVDGELGEYVAANHDSYKKIVIAPAITLTGSATDGIKVKVENLKGSATLIVAQYEGGKMVDVQMQTVSADNTYGFAGLTHKTGCTYKAFLVNSTSYAPLCAADEF